MKLAVRISILLFLFISCNKTINCRDPYINLAFIAKPKSDIDTITLRKYSINTNFTQLIDTFNLIENSNSIMIPSQTRDTILIRPTVSDLAIENGYDWQIFIPSTRQIFFITNIVTQSKTQKCGTFSTSCFCNNDVVSIRLNNVDILTRSFRSNVIFIR